VVTALVIPLIYHGKAFTPAILLLLVVFVGQIKLYAMYLQAACISPTGDGYRHAIVVLTPCTDRVATLLVHLGREYLAGNRQGFIK
jgi:hypothetical protein